MRYKRPVVQLTTLLDLLFIMIFVSLNQTASSTQAKTEAPKEPTPPVAKVEAPAPKKPVNKEILINAEFHFYETASNPNIPRGSFRMKGTYQTQKGLIALGGVEWIQRPEDYDMVPLKGIINEDRTLLQGKIEFHGCEVFTLTRVTKSGTTVIGGEWQGKYTCLQGDTGLTLKIL